MCDGQFKVMQHFLREQTEDIHGVNMVREMATSLYELSENRVINVDTLQLHNQLLQAIKEFVVGNYENRKVAFDANVVSVINYILQIDIMSIKWTDASASTVDPADSANLKRMALEIKASAVELLDVLLEEISSTTFQLSQQIAKGLDISALHWSMLDFFVLKDDLDLKRICFDYRALYCAYRIIMGMMDMKVAPLHTLSKFHVPSVTNLAVMHGVAWYCYLWCC